MGIESNRYGRLSLRLQTTCSVYRGITLWRAVVVTAVHSSVTLVKEFSWSFLFWLGNLTLCDLRTLSSRWGEAGGGWCIPWGRPLPAAGVSAALAVPSGLAGRPGQRPLHRLDGPWHGVQTHRTGGGKDPPYTSFLELCLKGDGFVIVLGPLSV